MVLKSDLGPSRLSHVLKYLSQPPSRFIPGLSSLSIFVPGKQREIGTRIFTKKELPRFHYANQLCNFIVDMHASATGSGAASARLTLKFSNRTSETLKISGLTSSDILTQLLRYANTSQEHDAAAISAGKHASRALNAVTSRIQPASAPSKSKRMQRVAQKERKMKAREAWTSDLRYL